MIAEPCSTPPSECVPGSSWAIPSCVSSKPLAHRGKKPQTQRGLFMLALCIIIWISATTAPNVKTGLRSSVRREMIPTTPCCMVAPPLESLGQGRGRNLSCAYEAGLLLFIIHTRCAVVVSCVFLRGASVLLSGPPPCRDRVMELLCISRGSRPWLVVILPLREE